VEHYYQAQKSPSRAAIRAAQHPGHVKRLSAPPDAKVRLASGSWFAQNGKHPRADWEHVKLDITKRGDHAKYAQNAGLAARLLATGAAELIEDSESDGYWGIGKDGIGPNWAGRVLMEVRDHLRQRSS
jgi:ribA/ribD-fused uncharacterized protein